MRRPDHATPDSPSHPRSGLARHLRSAWVGYPVALGIPLAVLLSGARAGVPPFVFEHVVVLFVVGVAVLFGMGPAVTAAVVAALGGNVLLHAPVWRPTIGSAQDVLDLVLFVGVAVTVGWLVASARRERERAEAAAARERHAREERDRLVSMVTHDLATPLGVIRGSIQFARRAGSQPSLDLDRLLSRLDVAAIRATSLIRTLGDARTIDAGTLSLDKADTDLRQLLSSVVQMMDQFSDRHPVALGVPGHPIIVSCDTERLQRVIQNLITNAIKYSPDGGAVEVSLTSEQDQAVITVRDYGIGISPEALPHVFERGFRAKEAIATAPGLGLGLAISAEIVKRHGGRIAATPAEPSGTTFTVWLPLARPASPAIDMTTRRAAS
jgi:signal transduction histidine kinase